MLEQHCEECEYWGVFEVQSGYGICEVTLDETYWNEGFDCLNYQEFEEE